MKTLTKAQALKLKKGDIVVLQTTDKSKSETHNWLEVDSNKCNKKGNKFTVTVVYADGWLGFKEVAFGHPYDKFSKAK